MTHAAAWGSALFLLAAPGVVAGLVPWLLAGWAGRGPLAPLGWVPVVVGRG